ncbi:MAG: glycosyl transferase family 2 [Frankiales bacterium]|nr:glycosyl transferase family 2 [Frankiales bacterium]
MTLPPSPLDAAHPQVTVLMATLNGQQWIAEQLDSILGQAGVDVSVLISDDGSTDGTWEWLQARAIADPRIALLPRVAPSGTSAANFYRLLRDVDLAGCDLVALADQDDVWLPGKLASQVALVRGGADGVSSDVTAFWPDGTRRLVRKSRPQRTFDQLFEGPGPGSTFLLSHRLATLVQELLRDETSHAGVLDFHDWLIYAICRAKGWRWVIQDEPTVDYRQHEANVLGANSGLRSARHRFGLIRQHWHREQAVELARVSLEVASPATRPELERMLTLLLDTGMRSRLGLLWRTPQVRRTPRDRVLLGAMIAVGVW